MSFLAERMNSIDASGIRKVFALAAKMKDPVNLSIGQPDYDVDDGVKDAAIDAIRRGFNGYTQTWGTEELRAECIAYYQRKFDTTLENVMITSGTSGGLFLALMATINPGDEVLFADPYFVMYPHLVRVLGGVAKPIDTYPDFRLTAERVEAAITPKTKVLIVNAPSNPTGITLNANELQALADVAKKHNLLVLSDEIYEALSYDDPPATMAGRYDQVLLLNGLSKTAGMTGWRVGFASGPESVIQAMNTLQQYTFVCAPSICQAGAVEALRANVDGKIAGYRAKRDKIYEGLQEKFQVEKPGGAFYIFPEAPGGDGDEFVRRAIEHNLLIIPGSVFSNRKTHFRISFAATDNTLEKGLEILNRIADSM